MKDKIVCRNAPHSFLLYLMLHYEGRIKSLEYEEEIMDEGMFAYLSFSLDEGTEEVRDACVDQLKRAGWTSVVSTIKNKECRIRAIKTT